MSYSIFILGSSAETLSMPELREFIADGVFFDPPSEFTDERAGDETMTGLRVQYDPKRPSIAIRRVSKQDEIDGIREEIVSAVTGLGRGGEVDTRNLDRVLNCRQIWEILVTRGTLTKDAWAFLDCLEAFLARQINGLVFATDDGLYDERLTRLTSISK